MNDRLTIWGETTQICAEKLQNYYLWKKKRLVWIIQVMKLAKQTRKLRRNEIWTYITSKNEKKKRQMGQESR